MPLPQHINPATGKRYGYVPPEKRGREHEEAAKALEKEIQLLERAKVILEAKENLLTFTKLTMPDPEDINNVHRSRYEPAKFHEEVASVLESVERGEITQLIFCMPPRHGKSALATQSFAAWYSGRHPDHDIAVASYSDTMAVDFGSNVRALMHSPQYKQVFPNHKLRRGGNAKDNIQTDKGGRIVFVGRGSALTGRGAHCFPAGTLVETSVGAVPIERLTVSHEVLSYDRRSDTLVFRRVAAIARRPKARLLRITSAAGRVVEATADHKFYVSGAWVEARSLSAGDPLVCAVRDDVLAPGVRRVQTPAAGPIGVLLLEQVLGRGGKFKAARRAALRSVRGASAAPKIEGYGDKRPDFLLEGVSASGAGGGVGHADAFSVASVRALQRYVYPASADATVLRAGVLGSRPLHTDVGGEQPALGQRSGRAADGAAQYAQVQGDAAAYSDARRGRLRFVQEHRSAGGTPHRRESDEQQSRKSGHGLSAVSSSGSFFRGEGDFVVSVEDTRRDAVVYDIQVEETECFFANGVLAHNCLLIDDIFKDHEEARSQAIRDQAWNWFTKVAMTRRMGKRLVVITMTRWHSDDIIGRITDPDNPCYNAVEAAKWKIIRLPAIAEEDDSLGRKPGEALWPERYDVDFLHSQMRLDPLGFAALYQQRPTVADGVLFRRENIQFYKSSELPDELRYYCASDHAVGTGHRNDPSCFVKVGVDKQNNIYLVDVFWQKVPTDRAVEAMLTMASGDKKPLLWWAEKGHISKSIGPFLYKRMQESGIYINLVEVTPAKDKEQRAQSIAARVAMGKVYFPKDAFWTERAVSEMLAFPNGNRDDFVDALAYIGLGLQSQFGASVKKKTEEPKFGTLAWVKLADKWKAEQDEARRYGGF